VEVINPTGKGIRNDEAGLGHHGAPRGKRKHNGTDFMCTPGQNVFSPISGKVERLSRPYADDSDYSGIVIGNEKMTVQLFYLDPSIGVGAEVDMGDIIGIAQDISKKHGGGMKPHIHLRIVDIDPMELIPYNQRPDKKEPPMAYTHI
jgi:hypothetical protein